MTPRSEDGAPSDIYMSNNAEISSQSGEPCSDFHRPPSDLRIPFSAVQMDPSIAAAAELIQNPHGEQFLRLMASAYHGLNTAKSNGESNGLLATARKLGLINQAGERLQLTAAGFLVGNVAKEYCQYLDDGRLLAPPKPTHEMVAGKDVLDVGCSFGRWLWEFQRDARSSVGIEPQEEYAVLGRALSIRERVPNARIVVGAAEDLDRLTSPASCDLVFSRLVLMYVRVRPVLDSMVAALRLGGILWIQVDPPWILFRQLFNANDSWRKRAWTLLAMLNLPICVLTGRQLSISSRGRINNRHNPAYLPLWWWRKELRRRGLKDFRTFPANSLVFCARK